MRIFIIDSTIDEPFIGGGHLYLPGLAEGLVNKGHEVTVLVKGQPNDRVGKFFKNEVKILKGVWNKFDLAERNAKKLAVFLNKEKPDVFFISNSHEVGWLVLPLLSPEIATCAIVHTDSDTYYNPIGHYKQFLTAVIGVSPEVCDKLEKDIGVANERIFWVPYGVDGVGSLPDSVSGLPRLIYVGRLDSEQKRSADLCKIYKGLRNHGLECELVVVGDGPLYGVMKEELNMFSDRVTFTGWIDKGEVLRRLRAAQLFLLTSEYEGFCIALVESMANGCCPVVTDIESGNGFLVKDGENGYLVPVGDIDMFINRIRELFNDPEKLKLFRTRSLQLGNQFNKESMIRKYEATFLESIKKNSGSKREVMPSFPIMESCLSVYPFWMRRIKAMFKMAIGTLLVK